MTAVMEKTPTVFRMKVDESCRSEDFEPQVESVHIFDCLHISLSVPFEKYHVVVEFLFVCF